MHGEGHRRNCKACGQSVEHMRDVLGNRELQGPRQITSSDIDRIFDDKGRFLAIEEKGPNERLGRGGQWRLLVALAAVPEFTVWGVRGTAESLTIARIFGDGSTAQVARGTFMDYQRAVLAWFNEQRAEPLRWIDALGESPFTAPEWCPAEAWNEFDRGLVGLMKRKP